jgi:uncharacterized protein (TIGR03067 family)
MRHDLDRLQGVWTVTSMEVDGQTMPAAMLAEARIAIKGNRFTSTGMGAVYQGTLAVDEATSPRQLTMKFDAGPEKGNTNPCIYQLDGDHWKLCLATRGAVRPSSFATAPGSGFALETLARGDAPVTAKAKAPASKKTAPAKASPATPASVPVTSARTEFEGEWRMVSGIMDGHPMEKSLVEWVKRVTKGNQTTVFAGPQVMMKMEFTSDSSTSPKTIDYFNIAGSNKGKAQYGIFEFEGDLLKICVSAPDGERPSRFLSTPGDGGMMTVWKRA